MIESRSKFHDNRGGVWTVVLDDEIIDRVKQRHGIELIKEAKNLIGLDVSITLQFRILFTVLEHAIKARGLNEFTIQELLDEVHLLRGMEAILWAAVDYQDFTPEGVAIMKDLAEELIAATRRYEAVIGVPQ